MWSFILTFRYSHKKSQDYNQFMSSPGVTILSHQPHLPVCLLSLCLSYYFLNKFKQVISCYHGAFNLFGEDFKLPRYHFVHVKGPFVCPEFFQLQFVCFVFVLSASLCPSYLLPFFLSLSPSFPVFLSCLSLCLSCRRRCGPEKATMRGCGRQRLQLCCARNELCVREVYIMKTNVCSHPKRGNCSSFNSFISTNHQKSREETRLWVHQALLFLATGAQQRNRNVAMQIENILYHTLFFHSAAHPFFSSKQKKLVLEREVFGEHATITHTCITSNQSAYSP